MTWFRSDDGFPEHPKCDALALHFGSDWQHLSLAFALWHHLGCDCAARRTDGAFNAARAYRVMRAPRRAVDVALAGLVAVGLLHVTDSGFTYHDWEEYQPTRAQLDAERVQKTQRQARWRASKPATETAGNKADRASVDGAVDASTHASVDASVDGAVDPAPARPVPARPVPDLPTVGQGSAEGGESSGGAAPSGHTPGLRLAQQGPQEPRKRRQKPSPVPDTIPAEGTPARAVYDALVRDALLRPITPNPGDFAARVTDPAAYPGVAVLAEILRAAEWHSRQPHPKRDGRAFLGGWLRRAADERAGAPQPAAAPPPTPPRPARSEAELRARSPFADFKERLDARDARR